MCKPSESTMPDRDEMLDSSAETYSTIARVRLSTAGLRFSDDQIRILLDVMRLASRDAAGIGEGYAFAEVAGGKSRLATVPRQPDAVQMAHRK